MVTQPQPTHGEVIAWINKKIKVAQANIEIYKTENARAVMWLEEFPNSGTGKFRVEQTRFMLQDWKERLAQLLANRDVLEEKPIKLGDEPKEVFIPPYILGHNDALEKLQTKALQRIAEVM